MGPNRCWCRVTVSRPDGLVLGGWTLHGPGEPDLRTVDGIARLALLAGRLGARVTVSRAAPPLPELIELAALPVEVQR